MNKEMNIDTNHVVSDFLRNGDFIQEKDRGIVSVLFLGGTIGNLVPDDLSQFLNNVYNTIPRKGKLFVTIDTNTDMASLRGAYYNDSLKELTLNTMRYASQQLCNELDPKTFKTHYHWNFEENQVELSVSPTTTQKFEFCNKKVIMPEGEKYHVITSKKYTSEEMSEIAHRHNFECEGIIEEEGNPIKILVLVRK